MGCPVRLGRMSVLKPTRPGPPREGVVGREGRPRQVGAIVRVEAGRAAAAEEALARQPDDQRQAGLVTLNAVDLPAAHKAVNPAALVQEASALAEGKLNEIVDDED